MKPGQFYTVIQNFKLKAKAAEVSTANISPTLCILAFYMRNITHDTNGRTIHRILLPKDVVKSQMVLKHTQQL